MYFGTHKLTDRFSIHSELQLRLYEPTTNFNQLLPRVGLNYHINDDAMATGGYAYIPTSSFVKGEREVTSTEHRIWQQFILRNKLGGLKFEHRYRLEQRWISTEGDSDYRNRARYRLFFSVPLQNPQVESTHFFLAFYNEIFLNLSDNPFDQNRLYGALGYKASPLVSLQAGFLRHRAGSLNLNRLQLALFLNT